MSRIRPLRRADLPQVAALYERVARSGAETPPPGLGAYFARTVLDHPWADEDVPSLVYEADGAVLGFLGSHVRRLRFDGAPIRMGCCGQFVVDPRARRRGVGALLLRHYLAGPQDLTTTDTGSEEVRAMWERLGGHTSFLRSLSWLRPLRPWQAGGDVLRRRWRLLPLLDGLSERLSLTPFRVRRPETSATPLTPPALVAHLAQVTGHLRLRPEYDERSFAWVLEELARVRSHGELVARMVCDPAGRTLGWYVTYLRPGGVSQVMQIAAAEGDVGAVVDDLFHHARQRGAVALQGRLEPLLFNALSRRRCLFRDTERALMHSRDPEIAATVDHGRGLLTRMEGEWWMGHHLEPFATAA